MAGLHLYGRSDEPVCFQSSLKQRIQPGAHPPGGKSRQYIVLHDTTTFGETGETPGHRGLWPAVEEFLAKGTFRLKQRHMHNNGLTILERIERLVPAESAVPL
jgi:hypothetical protein